MVLSIIGTGRIGVLLEEDQLRYKPCTHLGAIKYFCNKNKSVNLDYLCDLDPDRLDKATRYLSLKKVRTTQDYNLVIENKPDILVIASNTSSHYEIASAAIMAGISKLVIEKPITLRKREARNIFKMAEKTNTHVWVNYERRFHPKYLKLRQAIASERPYGKLLYYRGWFASSNPSLFRVNPENEGALLHDTTHLLDLVQFLFGKIIKNRSKITQKNQFTQLHTLKLKHLSDFSGEIWTTTSNLFFHFEIELFFQFSRIVVGNGFFREEKLQRSKLYKNFISLGDTKTSYDQTLKLSDNPFIKLYQDVLQDNYQRNFFKDACDNVSILTTS